MDLQALYNKTALIKASLLRLEDELSDRFGNLTTGEGNTANPRELYAAFKAAGLIAEDAERQGLTPGHRFKIVQSAPNGADLLHGANSLLKGGGVARKIFELRQKTGRGGPNKGIL